MRKFYITAATVLIGAATVLAADPISVEPAGKAKDMYRSATAHSLFYGIMPQVEEIDAFAQRTVFADDGSVYILNPFSAYFTDTWMKGKVEGNTLIFTFPQPMFDTDGGMLYVNSFVNTGSEDFPKWQLSEVNEVRYELKDGVYEQVGDNVIGLSFSDNEFINYGDQHQKFYEYPEAPSVLPSGSKVVTYSMVEYKGDDAIAASLVSVGINGTDLYVGNLPKLAEGLWIKGSMADGKIVVPKGEYVGADYDDDYHIFFSSCESKYDEEFVKEGNVEFDFDDATSSFSYDGMLVLNRGVNKFNSLAIYSNPTFSPWADLPSTPEAPVIEDFDNSNESWGNYVDFLMPFYGVDGQFLNPKDLSFRIYVDDELYVFKKDKYNGLTEDVTEIPFGFDNEGNLTQYKAGYEPFVYYYGEDLDKNPYKRFGVQAIYRGGGEEHASAITYALDESGVEDVAIDKVMQSVEYYDMQGRKIVEPENGVFIKLVKYTDGSCKSTKILKK